MVSHAWKSYGDFLENHMVVVVLCCLFLGAAFPNTFSFLARVAPFLFMFNTFQGSLGNSFSSMRAVFRRPLALCAILFVAHIVLPGIAFLVGLPLYGDDPAVLSGMVLEYAVPVATSSILWTSVYDGDISLCLSAVLISALISPFMIPLTLQVTVGAGVSVDALSMMRQLVILVAIPAMLGTSVNELTHSWGKRSLSPTLSPLARTFLGLIIIGNTTGIADDLQHLTPQLVEIIVVCGLFCMLGYVLAFVLATLMRQPRDLFIATSFAASMKNISAGAVIARAYLPAESLLPVMAGTLYQQVFASVVGKLIVKHVSHEEFHQELSPHDATQLKGQSEKHVAALGRAH